MPALSGCRTPSRPPAELVRRSEPLLGTFVTISAYGTNHATLDGAVSAAFEEFRRADELLSIHRPDSELSRVNAHAAIRSVVVSRELFAVLTEAQTIASQTDGAFDLTIGPLTRLWGFIWKEYRLPTDADLKAVLPLVNFRLVELDPGQHSVYYLTNGVSLDPGGIGKGWAVDRAIERLRALGIRDAMVKAGGDLRVMGAPPGERDWQVQIEDPEKRGDRIVIRLRDAALSTSGDYENYFTMNSVRYAHILDPRTGLPVRGVASCTVIAPTCMESDAWATALFVLGPEQSLTMFGRRFPIRFVLNSDSTASESWQVRQSFSFPRAQPCAP